MAQRKETYESFRSLIIFLGLIELAWIGCWLLRSGDAPSGYRATAIAWIVAMLGWLVVVVILGRRDFFLRHTRWFSNLAGSTPGTEFLLAWHGIGLTVFFGAGISMFFSVPSPIRIYQGLPDTSIVFKFPMILAPNFTVPLFMLAHAFALVKLIA